MAKSSNRNKYKSTNINKLNSHFYTNVDNVFSVSGLADFFTKIEPIQIALAKKIENLIKKSRISVLELGTGSDISRWQIISGIIRKKWVVKLTDFSNNVLPDTKMLPPKDNFSFATEKLDLLQPFRALREKDKVDVILATYVFDSIWFPRDLHLEKIKNKWYQAAYRIKGTFINKSSVDEYIRIKIEKKLNKVNLKEIKNGKIISDYYQHKENIKINYPGGLIDKVEEAFDRQISRGGIFIIGDMAVNSKSGFIPKESPKDKAFYMEDYHTSGKVAKFKVEDYGLAKKILEKERFSVRLETVEDFVKNSGYEIPLKVKDHWIMVISK